jgi:hypothetical protein
MRGISWLAATTGQLLKKHSAPWSKKVFQDCFLLAAKRKYSPCGLGNQ